MENLQADLLDKFYEYNLWANTEMLKFCSQLTGEQLQTELAGTPGTIRKTLEHLVSAEGVYVMHATGSRPWPASCSPVTRSTS